MDLQDKDLKDSLNIKISGLKSFQIHISHQQRPNIRDVIELLKITQFLELKTHYSLKEIHESDHLKYEVFKILNDSPKFSQLKKVMLKL